MADGVGDHAEKLGLGIDRVVSVQALETIDRQLPRGRRGLLIDARKRHKATEFLRENAADQTRLAHAQHNAVTLRPVEQIKSLEAIVDVLGRVDQFGNSPGTGLLDVAMKLPDVSERALEVVGGQNQSAPGPTGEGRFDPRPNLGLGEVRVFKVDELRPRFQGRQQDFDSQGLGMIPRPAFLWVATGHNHRHRRGDFPFGFGDQGDHRIPVEAVQVVRPQLQHLGPGRYGLPDLPDRPVHALCRDGDCQIRHDSPDI